MGDCDAVGLWAAGGQGPHMWRTYIAILVTNRLENVTTHNVVAPKKLLHVAMRRNCMPHLVGPAVRHKCEAVRLAEEAPAVYEALRIGSHVSRAFGD
eukprot:319010-Chlamydomonas_euryale.AAC.4